MSLKTTSTLYPIRHHDLLNLLKELSVGMITIGILYNDFMEDNKNSIQGGRMSVTSGFWGVLLRFPIEVRSSSSNPQILTAENILKCQFHYVHFCHTIFV